MMEDQRDMDFQIFTPNQPPGTTGNAPPYNPLKFHFHFSGKLSLIFPTNDLNYVVLVGLKSPENVLYQFLHAGMIQVKKIIGQLMELLLYLWITMVYKILSIITYLKLALA